MHTAIINPSFLYPRRMLPVLALSLMAAGCATVAPPAGTGAAAPSSRAEQALRPYYESIDLGGRLSVRYQQNGNDQAVHGSFTWAQSPERTVVSLLSPLGQTMATIEITPLHSILTQAGQPPRIAADVDELAADALGWPLPVSGLREWLQGFATDASGRRLAVSPLAANTNLMTSDGWRLSYPSWQNDADTMASNHPRRIDLERSTAQAGDVAMRIVIDSWQPH